MVSFWSTPHLERRLLVANHIRFDPNSALYALSRRRCHLHDQPIVVLQFEPLELLQVCRPTDWQGDLRESTVGLLFYPIVLQAHAGQTGSLHRHGGGG